MRLNASNFVLEGRPNVWRQGSIGDWNTAQAACYCNCRVGIDADVQLLPSKPGAKLVATK